MTDVDIGVQLGDYLKSCIWFPQQEPYAILTSYMLLALGSDLFDAVPYLYFQGPPGSGKTEVVV